MSKEVYYNGELVSLTVAEKVALITALTTTMDQRFYDEQSGIERNLLSVHDRSNIAKVVCEMSGDILAQCDNQVFSQVEPWTVGTKPMELNLHEFLNQE